MQDAEDQVQTHSVLKLQKSLESIKTRQRGKAKAKGEAQDRAREGEQSIETHL